MPLVRLRNADGVMQTIRELSHNFAPVGEGNVVSVEFNLLYRWHATLSEKDTTWTETAFNEIFEGKDLSEVNPYHPGSLESRLIRIHRSRSKISKRQPTSTSSRQRMLRLGPSISNTISTLCRAFSFDILSFLGSSVTLMVDSRTRT